MSDWNIELAKELKKRDNKEPFEPVIGDVISIEPLKIAVYGNTTILEPKDCYMCSAMVERFLRKADMRIKSYSVGINTTDSAGHSNSSMTVNDKADYDVEITFKEIIKVGDKLLCLPTGNGQMFYIIDKVVIM